MYKIKLTKNGFFAIYGQLHFSVNLEEFSENVEFSVTQGVAKTFIREHLLLPSVMLQKRTARFRGKYIEYVAIT